MNIAIIGRGAFGTALGQILTENLHIIKYYDPVDTSTSLPAALDGAEAILVVVPSIFLADTITTLRPLYTNQPMIIATKGITDLSILAGIQYSLLAGAGFADDILDHQPTTFTVTSPLAAQLFANDYITIEQTTDTQGIALCGSLKNIYAIGAGLLHLQPDTTDFDTYINRAALEMGQVLSSAHAQAATVDLSCGRPDLILTCSGTHSRNYAYGFNFPTPIQGTVEGYSALQSLPAHINGDIITLIRNIIFSGASPDTLKAKLGLI